MPRFSSLSLSAPTAEMFLVSFPLRTFVVSKLFFVAFCLQVSQAVMRSVGGRQVERIRLRMCNRKRALYKLYVDVRHACSFQNTREDLSARSLSEMRGREKQTNVDRSKQKLWQFSVMFGAWGASALLRFGKLFSGAQNSF